MFVAKHFEGFLKGRVQAEELRGQFGERMPGAYQAAARAMGVTTEELAKMSENGELVAEDLLPALSRELMIMANSGDQLEASMNNTNSALNRFSNNVLLANMRFQESGMDKGIRDLANSAADFLFRADELWELMGGIGPVLFAPFRSLFELFGALSDRFEGFSEVVKENESSFKVLAALAASLFGWSRKLLFAFVLLPAAISNVAALIDGEQLTWTQWATTLAGIAVSLGMILKAKKGIGNFFRGSGASASTSTTSSTTSTTVSEKAQRAARVVARGADWQRTGQSTLQKVWSNIKGGFRTGSRGGGFVPIGLGSKLSEEEFLEMRRKRLEEPSPLDLIGQVNQAQDRERQTVFSGDMTFNINGEDSKGIADEVMKTIQGMYRETSINEPSQEK